MRIAFDPIVAPGLSAAGRVNPHAEQRGATRQSKRKPPSAGPDAPSPQLASNFIDLCASSVCARLRGLTGLNRCPRRLIRTRSRNNRTLQLYDDRVNNLYGYPDADTTYCG